jgi:sortase (surface protein transpeptidase)
LKLVRNISLAALAVGALLMVVGVACSGGDGDETTPAAAQPTDAETSTPQPTATNTPPPTPTATPTPFDGKVARLKIPRFGVDAYIEELAINSRNELDTPKDTNKAVGWYYIYDKPGHLGNAMFSAHVYYHSIPAPFVSLSKAVAGDKIMVQMEDGTEYTYEVISNTRYHRDQMDMGAIIWPTQKADYDEWVTLITCGGELDSTGQEYISRDVVVGKRLFQ